MQQRKTLQYVAILMGIAALVLGCLTVTGTPPPSSQTVQPTVIQPTAPGGWKVSTDSSGQCQVATPPNWELERDFFLKGEKAYSGPFMEHSGSYPPTGAALWKDNPDLEGHYFQSRRTLMVGDLVCSVWRIQADINFTGEQERELDEVGKTLREVQK